MSDEADDKDHACEQESISHADTSQVDCMVLAVDSLVPGTRVPCIWGVGYY